MDCNELKQLIPDLVEGTLTPATLAEAQAALANCPECAKELEIARQIRAFLVELQAENEMFRVPPGFEVRLLERVRRQSGGLDIFDLSSKAFAAWLIELINLIGGLLDPTLIPKARPRPTAGD
jgi:anti-sigma factor RsiW